MEDIITKLQNLNYNEQNYFSNNNFFEEEPYEEPYEEFCEESCEELRENFYQENYEKFSSNNDVLKINIDYEYINKLGHILETIIVEYKQYDYSKFMTENFYNELNKLFNEYYNLINGFINGYYGSFIIYNKIQTLKIDINNWNKNKCDDIYNDIITLKLAYKILKNMNDLKNLI